MNNFGIRLKKILESSPLNQKQLANEIGVKEPTITGYIKGDYFPSIEIASKIAKALNVSLDYLVNGHEPEKIKYRELEEFIRTKVITDNDDTDLSKTEHKIIKLLREHPDKIPKCIKYLKVSHHPGGEINLSWIDAVSDELGGDDIQAIIALLVKKLRTG